MSDDEAERIVQQLSRKLADDMMAVLCGSGALQRPRPTALRLTPSCTFEVVEIDDAGKIIEPAQRCPKCGPILLCSAHMCA